MKHNPPWLRSPLDQWNIVGMNHYFIEGKRRLFVAMIRGDRCIVEEGPDDQHVWNRLWRRATESAE